ncbi:hypothetical protein TELCIR_12542 [Teladorsagia circumcincta]|uniref:CDP-diacylglycerol--glycerol-3-phosphate 3-phosphatidyltransferase n=1 Tax=Teladorsagia circumcincta TaxID=45464 RepID=A0A2G9U669_TELCI|nr:hypothetical protein TELCIR_12542 [Teladorsagia circumcincta]
MFSIESKCKSVEYVSFFFLPGYRSVHRDLEAQILLVTSNERLRGQLKDERTRLLEFASTLDATALKRVDHYIPSVVRILSRFIRNFF